MPHIIFTHDCLRWEVRINVAIAVLTVKVCRRNAPGAWIRFAGSYIGGNCISRKEVDSDEGARPFHSKHTSTLCIERWTVATNGSFNTAADRIVELAIVVIVIRYSQLIIGWRVEGAITTSVKAHIDLIDIVKAFVDVDLTIGTRFITNCPTKLKFCK